MPKINSLEVVHQDTNKDSYDNLHDLLVSLKETISKEVVDAQARASYEALLELYTNDQEAFAKRIETLQTEFGDSIANVVQEIVAFANVSESYAKKIEELSAKAFDNEVKITNEALARATADESLAKLTSLLKADFESATVQSNAAIKQESIARANAEEAFAQITTTLTAELEDTKASVTAESLARATADSALALEISSLTAGANVGFDAGDSWYFDTTSESWTASNASVVWNNGWIDVEATSTNPSIISPTIDIVGSKYNVIKARIQRKSGSTWSGTAYYSTGSHGFSSSYIKTIPEPSPFAVGDFAVIEFDMSDLTAGGTDWISSTITQIKLELGSASDDDISVDWISVGRNSPGASVASVEEEKLARATADTALASSITSLSATVGTNTAAISSEATARANADSALASDITDISARLDTGDFATVKEYAEASVLKNRTYRQITQPPTGVAGDLWFDTDNNNQMYRYDGTDWIASSDSSTLTEWIADTYTSDISDIFTQLDSKVETWFQTTDPSVSWTTDVLKSEHDGDLWYNSDTNEFKRYARIAVNTGVWNLIQDQVAIDAANAAAAAQETADGKVVTFAQTTTPTAEGVGDLWIDTDANNKLYRWNGSTWLAVDDGRIEDIRARWGVSLDVNNNIAGIELLNGTNTSSSFTVAADKFIVKKPDGTNGISWDGTTSALAISGDVYARSFNGLSVINTPNIVTHAVTNAVSASGGYSATISFTLSEASVAYVLGTLTQGDGRDGLRVAMWLNGPLLYGPEIPRDGTLGAMAVVTTLPAGSNTISIGAYEYVGDMRCSILCLILKR